MFPCNYTTLYLYPLKGKLLTSKPTNHSNDPAESLFLAHETWGNGASHSFMEALQSLQLITLFSFCWLESSQRRKEMKVCEKHMYGCLHLYLCLDLVVDCHITSTHLDVSFTTGYHTYLYRPDGIMIRELPLLMLRQ